MAISLGAGYTRGAEKTMTTIHVVLPAYNEAEALKTLLPDLTSNLSEGWMKYHIYVVDDGSIDSTSSVVKGFSDGNITLLSHRRNQGLAEAINTGFRAALKESGDDDIIVSMDADSTHLPGLISRMVRLIKEGNDIVISSRFVQGARVRGVPFTRVILSVAASWLFRILFPIEGIKDYTCGYRAYRVGLLKHGLHFYGKTFIDQKGFSCMVDLLLKLSIFDPIVTEVPMILRYDLKPGKSKMNVGNTITETLVLMIKRRWQLHRIPR